MTFRNLIKKLLSCLERHGSISPLITEIFSELIMIERDAENIIYSARPYRSAQDIYHSYGYFCRRSWLYIRIWCRSTFFYLMRTEQENDVCCSSKEKLFQQYNVAQLGVQFSAFCQRPEWRWKEKDLRRVYGWDEKGPLSCLLTFLLLITRLKASRFSFFPTENVNSK